MTLFLSVQQKGGIHFDSMKVMITVVLCLSVVPSLWGSKGTLQAEDCNKTCSHLGS